MTAIEPAAGIVWLAYDMDRSSPPREFQNETGLKLRDVRFETIDMQEYPR